MSVRLPKLIMERQTKTHRTLEYVSGGELPRPPFHWMTLISDVQAEVVFSCRQALDTVFLLV